MTILTTLTTSGNSRAVRLPKSLLQLSGLGERVTLEARSGKIIIANPQNPRDGWEDRIKALVDDSCNPNEATECYDAAIADGLDNAPWDGPSYQDWMDGKW